jgi:hypothetical protein
MRGNSAVSEVSDILSEMVILPVQYFCAIGRRGLSSEQRLMLAVLVDAINVLHQWRHVGTGRRRREFTEAARWVNRRGHSDLFSFDNICDALEIEPAVLRSRLGAFTGATPATGPALERLRLNQVSRPQQMIANRWRRRHRRRVP